MYPNFFLTFPNLTRLEMPSCHLPAFPNMTGAASLVELRLHHNKIKSLPNISRLGFPEENVLETLWLYENRLDHPVAPFVWAGFPQLDTLDLRYCKIRLWPDMAYDVKLRRLFLSHNEISEFPSSPFLGLPSGNVLYDLQIQSNPFDPPPPRDTWTEFPNLEILHLENIGLTTWPNLSASFKLRYINLAKNNISGPPAHHGLPTGNCLREIRLQENQHFGADLNSQFFNGLYLQYLFLDNCGMAEFPNVSGMAETLNVLQVQSGLYERIDISNLIGSEFKISETTAIDNPLRELKVSSDNLKEFSDDILRVFSNLKRLEMSGEGHSFTGKMPNFTVLQNSLETLYLSNMEGVVIHNDDIRGSFQKMFRLRVLSMKFMSFVEFPFPAEFITDNLPALTTLYLDDNQMMSIVPDLSLLAVLHPAKPLWVRLSLCELVTW